MFNINKCFIKLSIKQNYFKLKFTCLKYTLRKWINIPFLGVVAENTEVQT